MEAPIGNEREAYRRLMASMAKADLVRRVLVRMLVFLSQLAIAGGFLELEARRLDKIEDSLEEAGLAGKIPASHDDSGAAMSFALMIEGKLDFGPDLERPFRQETDAFGRPLDMLLNEMDGVRITNCDTLALIGPCFGSDRHDQFL